MTDRLPSAVARWRRLGSLLGLGLLLSTVASGQTPTSRPTNAAPANALKVSSGGVGEPLPAPRESWQGVAQRLARVLVDPQARAKEEPLFMPGAQVWRFGRPVASQPQIFPGLFDGQTILSVHSWSWPTQDLVRPLLRDLERHLSNGPESVQSLLRHLTPAPHEQHAAERTATRWLSSALEPATDDPVAVIVLWNTSDTAMEPLDRLSLLLLKAGRLPDGRYRVSLVRFGSATDAVMEGY